MRLHIRVSQVMDTCELQAAEFKLIAMSVCGEPRSFGRAEGRPVEEGVAIWGQVAGQ